MSAISKLAKETAVYGLSSILGRFLNWLLVPLYTFVLTAQADYGIVTNLYAWTALLLVILTYGMETGFFRFASKAEKEGATVGQVYGSVLTSVFTTSLIFAVFVVIFKQDIANLLNYSEHSDFIMMLGIIIAADAFSNIPFSYLRLKGKAVQFASLKLIEIGVSIGFNLFFLLYCPKHQDSAFIASFYKPDYGVGYVFVSNFISTTVKTLLLIPSIFAEKLQFSWKLLKEILGYSLPLLILGIAGIMNQTLDKILFPYLYNGNADAAQTELGIYGACFKVAMVMMMFTQAFRYAYEPFIFQKHKDKNSVEAYADAMKWFVICSFLILLGMVFYLDLLKFIIAPSYWVGLRCVPFVLWAYVFQGVFFNLSLWYKLTDQTKWGAYLSLIGCAITLIINVLFVPKYGYMASAGASLACYFVVMLISYFMGRKHFPVPYDLKRIGLYLLVTLTLLIVYYALCEVFSRIWVHLLIGTCFLLIFIFCVLLLERINPIKPIKKIIHRKS